jgi:uncharacterized membrane protein
MERKTTRLEAFSDGIFGVAITLLAIEIGIKEYLNPTNSNLWQRILEHWPEYFTYFNSFAVVLLIWMGHNQIIDKINRINQWIILLNGLVLLLVVLFPFPTKIAGTFIETPAENTAVAFYAAYTGLIVMSILLLNIGILTNKHLLINPISNSIWIKKLIKGQFIAVLVYCLATIIAFYNVPIALTITFAMWIYWIIIMKEKDLN